MVGAGVVGEQHTVHGVVPDDEQAGLQQCAQ
jgi:hypothetical protein